MVPGVDVQPQLGQQVREVATDLSHAERVKLGLAKHGGILAYEKVKTAFLSDAPGHELALLVYVQLVMQRGRRVHGDVAQEQVAAVERLVVQVLNERERICQFARFEELDNGVFFARVNPNARVVPLAMDHFVERFSIQPFILYDEMHRMAGVYDLERWFIAVSDELHVPERTADERRFQAMWKLFYDSVSSEQRYNPDLRRSFMPKRMWRNLTEFTTALAS